MVKAPPVFSIGTSRAMGWSRSKIVMDRPARTFRRCSLNRLFRSAILTVFIVTY